MKEDKVSIIVPVYNAEKFIEETISCVINQTYKNWELILIDDMSKDNSCSIIKKIIKNNKDKDIKLIKLEEKGMAAGARNKGIEKATGRYLCYIDADDLWDKDKLEKQVQFMKEKKCAFSYTSYEFADENCKPSGKKVIAKEKLTYKQAMKNNIISTITVMFDLDKINKELLMMPNLQYIEDTASWFKILRNGYVAYGIPNVFSYYRRTPGTSSSNKFKTLKRVWNLYRKEEKLNIFQSCYYFFMKNINAILRRI